MARVSSVWTMAAIIAAVTAILCISGCGYSLQTSHSALLDQGVHTIYVAPLENDSYKPGVDNIVYNAVVKALSAAGGIRLVAKADLADAILHGTIGAAAYAPSATTTENQLYGGSDPRAARASSDIVVASEYSATLSVLFTLNWRNPPPGKKSVIWTSGFSRNERFPANNQLGIYGTTGPLINDSEFDRALKDMAQSMTVDLNESMLAMF